MTEERDPELDALIKAEVDDLRAAVKIIDGHPLAWWEGQHAAYAYVRENLVAKSAALVTLLDDAEVNHGGLLLVSVLKAKNELRLELARWGSGK